MPASNEIQSLIPPSGAKHQSNVAFRWGFGEALSEAAKVAHKYDMVMARMAGALAEIDLENPKVVDALGLNATFNIGTALRMYRELDEHQKTEGVE